VPANSKATITFPIGKTVYRGKEKISALTPAIIDAGSYDYIIE
jgi:hypothetical protein